ncbi:hypothetical protein BN844_4163 [Pseudomonas sp. SHC52]|nr:hypothetical protein BN844_4163 [Pseudomonas sp. SHC52]
MGYERRRGRPLRNSARPAGFRAYFRHRAPATLNQPPLKFQYI